LGLVKKNPYWSANLAKLQKMARRAWNRRASNPDAYSIAVSEYSIAVSGYSKARRKEERALYTHSNMLLRTQNLQQDCIK
jgi:hypothetical protein